MQAFSATWLLSIWERCSALRGRRRSNVLLQCSSPDGSELDLGAWTVGQWNTALLDLREAIFGSELALTLPCPHCKERLELELTVADLRCGPGSSAELSTETAGWHVQFRLPTLADLDALTPSRSIAALDAQLLERCVLAVSHDGSPEDLWKLPREARAQIDQRMREKDPQGESVIDVICSACQGVARATLDLGAVLWQELDAWAHHTISDVHLLASAYGWAEADVLSLSPRRRSLYLQLAVPR